MPINNEDSAHSKGDKRMNTNTLTPTTTKVDVPNIRRRLLRIHSTILFLIAVAAGLNGTVGLFWAAGPYGFLQQNPLAWNGLIQAYLLMMIVAVLIWLGANDAKARRWDVVGALAHLPPVIAVIFTWDAIQATGVGTIAITSLAFHTVWIVVETIAALYPDSSS
jgi:hypothetical protein